jgi:hypothetical protein
LCEGRQPERNERGGGPGRDKAKLTAVHSGRPKSVKPGTNELSLATMSTMDLCAPAHEAGRQGWRRCST